jgi:hypothetical protein
LSRYCHPSEIYIRNEKEKTNGIHLIFVAIIATISLARKINLSNCFNKQKIRNMDLKPGKYEAINGIIIPVKAKVCWR